MHKLIGILAAALVSSLVAATAMAQCSCGACQTSYVAPACASCSAPAVTYYEPVVYSAYYAPAASCSSCGYATYYTPYTTYYAPSCSSCYGSYYYAPYYVPGQPVRNVLRAFAW